MIISSEYDSFQRIAEGLKQAQQGAKEMARHRPDQAYMWEKLAEVFGVNVNTVYKLAEEGLTRTIKS